jgi:competence protein ComEC
VWPGTVPRGLLRATVVDVGQGDAVIVQCPAGEVVMVDAGGAGGSRFDIGRRVIEPAAWAAGVRRLDVLVLTHADADHANGAEAVLRDLRPAEVWEGVAVAGVTPLAAVRAAAADVRWRTVQRGDRVDIGGVTVRTWHPPPAEWERQRVRNDDSVVTEVRYRDVSLVFPGDVEAAGEAGALSAADRAPIRILLAPHHGSATSSGEAFLRALAPAVGIVSAGRGNRYGHPHAAALARWDARGVPVFRTDRDGAVTVTTDGYEAHVSTFTGRALTLRAGPPRAR